MIYLVIVVLLIFSNCKELSSFETVYFNDFESGDFDGLSGAVITEFQGSNVLGDYNNNGFTLNLQNLPDHDYLVIRMDLFIHGVWDGNPEGLGGPDIWRLELDDWIRFKNKKARSYSFETTFSNSSCSSTYCLQQSYPKKYPYPNSPRAGALNTEIPGICRWSDRPNGSSQYQVELAYPHSGSALSLKVYDLLVQLNSEDPKCDESWSIDNLELEIWTEE